MFDARKTFWYFSQFHAIVSIYITFLYSFMWRSNQSIGQFGFDNNNNYSISFSWVHNSFNLNSGDIRK